MTEPDFDTSGDVPLRRARFRSTFQLLGCEVCWNRYDGALNLLVERGRGLLGRQRLRRDILAYHSVARGKKMGS